MYKELQLWSCLPEHCSSNFRQIVVVRVISNKKKFSYRGAGASANLGTHELFQPGKLHCAIGRPNCAPVRCQKSRTHANSVVKAAAWSPGSNRQKQDHRGLWLHLWGEFCLQNKGGTSYLLYYARARGSIITQPICKQSFKSWHRSKINWVCAVVSEVISHKIICSFIVSRHSSM